jgi:predicted metalloprotease
MRWRGERQSGNLEDRRRMGPAGAAIGGGGLLLVIVVMLCMGADPQQLQKLMTQVEVGQQGGAQGPAAERPETPEEKESREFAATVLGFTEDVWNDQFQKAGQSYAPPRMVLFSDRVQTGCGSAPAAVGPFYCPADKTVYLDPTFFEELEQKLGGSDAEFSQAYVIAHEIGHHVQNLLGYSDLVHQKRVSLPEQEYNRWSVRLELQADYLAGVWAHYGQKRFQFIESGDVATAIKSAQAIGDDRLQRRSSGFVSPESFTHGTSEQRVKWFSLGLKTGDLGMLKEIFEMPYESL